MYVVPMGLFITLAVTCSCLMIRLFLLLDFFRNFLRRNLLKFNTLVFLPSFCLLDQFWAKGPLPGPFVSMGTPSEDTTGDQAGLPVIGYESFGASVGVPYNNFGMTVERVSAPPGICYLVHGRTNATTTTQRDDDDATMVARATSCCPHYFPSPLHVIGICKLTCY